MSKIASSPGGQRHVEAGVKALALRPVRVAGRELPAEQRGESRGTDPVIEVVDAHKLMEDQELVAEAAAGSAEAFDALVHRHTDIVWRTARAMLRDDFAAEEAAQDTFLKAYRNLHNFRGDSKVSTWLVSICRRTCIDKLRLKRAQVVSLDDMHREVGHTETPDLKVALEAALEHLPDDEREAFVLVEVVGHTREEAAEVVGVPASTMRSRVSRAREKLAIALGDARSGAEGG